MKATEIAATLLVLVALAFSACAETNDGDFTVARGENVSFDNLTVNGKLTVNGHLFVKNNLTAESIFMDGYGNIGPEEVKTNPLSKLVAGNINANSISIDRSLVKTGTVSCNGIYLGGDTILNGNVIAKQAATIETGSQVNGDLWTVNLKMCCGGAIVGKIINATDSTSMDAGAGIIAQNFTSNNVVQTSGSRITSRDRGTAGNITLNSGAEFNSGNKTLVNGNASLLAGYMNAPEVKIKGNADIQGAITGKNIKVGGIANQVEITAKNDTVTVESYWDWE